MAFLSVPGKRLQFIPKVINNIGFLFCLCVALTNLSVISLNVISQLMKQMNDYR